MLGLAVLLFAVVLLHGAIAESAAGHLVAGSTARATPPPAHPAAADAPTAAPGTHLVVRATAPCGTHEGRGDHGPGHPADHCASGQPNQGPALAQPRCAVSIGEATAPEQVPSAHRTGDASPTALSGGTVRSLVVRQI
ncbi:hypothetical protein [Streptomyces sp. HM190]|uniref:hypothetical protein n=1 Tax=Streptomyces sp. HM190 TaxID=2695266 RepID=UPI001357309D|nr:hypothetical protein [Streptomyces sp. HM190]